MPECPHKNAFPLCDGTEVLVILLATRSLSADLCAAFYHVCHWNAGLTAPVDTSTLGPQCRHAGVSYQSITFLFHRFKSPVKWGLYLQPANSLSLWSGFILCCRRLAVRGDGSILCSRAESSLGDHHGTHFQPSSSFSALSLCVCSTGVTSPSDNILSQLYQTCTVSWTKKSSFSRTYVQSTWFHVD